MKKKTAVLTIAVCALVPVFMVSAPSASAAHVDGCVHWNEIGGPAGFFGVNAYNRCNGYVIRRRPDVLLGNDGACKKMIPNHRYEWNLWSAYSVPFTTKVARWMLC
jgi:hypothetical protein